MPNSLSATGLTIATQAELLANFTTAAQQIYGPDIVLTSDSPDGQWIAVFIQTTLDTLDLLNSIYTGFDPDQAIGVQLDKDCAFNGIQRQAGTFTVTPITVTTTTSVNLYGLDQSVQPIYTVSDSAGNLWQLQTTQLGLSTGANVLNFQSGTPGAITTTPNTITVQVSVVLGVASVNNPTTYSTLGINEESDVLLRVRRAKSVSLGSQGYLAGLYAALENITGVTSAFVYENDTSSPVQIDPDDLIPSRTIWVIVAGSAAASAIANAIYIKRNAGCGMYGTQTYNVTQVDGTLFPVFWDTVSTVNLFIAFTATSLNGTTAPAIAQIRTGLVTSFVPTVFQEVNINALATQVQIIDSNTLVTNAGFTTGTVQTITLSGSAASGNFYIDYNGTDSTQFTHSSSASAIQVELRTLTGDTGLTVTGTPASGPIVITFSSTTNVQALFYVPITGAHASTLETSGPTLITFSYNENYTNTLVPNSRKLQFTVQASDIVILAVQLSPSSAVVAPLGTQTFTGLGGYGSYYYSFVSNNSGGSINSSTGVYVAGSTPLVTDEIMATDSMGNTVTANITVT